MVRSGDTCGKITQLPQVRHSVPQVQKPGSLSAEQLLVFVLLPLVFNVARAVVFQYILLYLVLESTEAVIAQGIGQPDDRSFADASRLADLHRCFHGREFQMLCDIVRDLPLRFGQLVIPLLNFCTDRHGVLLSKKELNSFCLSIEVFYSSACAFILLHFFE